MKLFSLPPAPHSGLPRGLPFCGADPKLRSTMEALRSAAAEKQLFGWFRAEKGVWPSQRAGRVDGRLLQIVFALWIIGRLLWIYCNICYGLLPALFLTKVCVLQDCIEIRIRSTKGPVDVYLCEVPLDNPDADSLKNTANVSCTSK